MPPASEIRDVKRFELKDAIPGAIYYHEKLKMRDQPTGEKRREHRREWHKNALAACSEAELVFLDPDNGIVVEPRSLRIAEKYAYAEEIEKYYERGQDVVYYCHKGRRKPDKWEEYKLLMKTCLPEAALMGLTFHRGTQRSYIFICRPEHAERYRSLLKGFLETEWGTDEKRPVFTEEWAEGFIHIQNKES